MVQSTCCSHKEPGFDPNTQIKGSHCLPLWIHRTQGLLWSLWTPVLTQSQKHTRIHHLEELKKERKVFPTLDHAVRSGLGGLSRGRAQEWDMCPLHMLGTHMDNLVSTAQRGCLRRSEVGPGLSEFPGVKRPQSETHSIET